MASQPGPHGPWSRTDMLLAAVLDAVGVLTHVQVSRAGVQSDPPAPLPRPGVVSQVKQTNPQALAFLQAIRDRHEQEQREAT